MKAAPAGVQFNGLLNSPHDPCAHKAALYRFHLIFCVRVKPFWALSAGREPYQKHEAICYKAQAVSVCCPPRASVPKTSIDLPVSASRLATLRTGARGHLSRLYFRCGALWPGPLPQHVAAVALSDFTPARDFDFR
jgi:hypothetical protein